MPAAPRKGELSMEIKEYQAAIEAVLFASGEPVAATRLAEVLELDLETAVRLADDWLQDVNTRGRRPAGRPSGRQIPAVHQQDVRGLRPPRHGYPAQHPAVPGRYGGVGHRGL